MTQSWAIRLSQADAIAAGALRLYAGVEALQTDGEVWLRGESLDEEVERALRKVPCVERYRQTDDGRLVAWGARVPSARLPEGTWTPLAKWMTPEARTTTAPDAPLRCVPLRLVRSQTEREASLLVAEARAWLAWAAEAPAARLKPLQFALSADERVLVRGTPVPPVRGRLFPEAEGIAVPCGFEWRPAVEPAVLRQLLSLERGDIALFSEDGSWERVPSSAFVRATRSAVRMSIAKE